ncbi:MAG: hypothetical protein LAO77_23170 [Acidobacteriia bacterium]|nr:hypothetical protein [Terriglobia bacterium]
MLLALTLVLGVIAYDLHRIAGSLAIVTGTTPAELTETRAQRDKRIQRERQELQDDFRAMLNTPPSRAPQPSKAPAK